MAVRPERELERLPAPGAPAAESWPEREPEYALVPQDAAQAGCSGFARPAAERTHSAARPEVGPLALAVAR